MNMLREDCQKYSLLKSMHCIAYTENYIESLPNNHQQQIWVIPQKGCQARDPDAYI